MTKLTKNPWFGSRQFGYGWTPLTWEAGAVCFAVVGLMIGAVALWRASLSTLVATFVVLGALALACTLAGGSPS